MGRYLCHTERQSQAVVHPLSPTPAHTPLHCHCAVPVQVGTFRTPLSDGWGITTIGSQMVLSDGSSKLTFVDPLQNFKAVKTVTVKDGSRSIGYLNEVCIRQLPRVTCGRLTAWRVGRCLLLLVQPLPQALSFGVAPAAISTAGSRVGSIEVSTSAGPGPRTSGSSTLYQSHLYCSLYIVCTAVVAVGVCQWRDLGQHLAD